MIILIFPPDNLGNRLDSQCIDPSSLSRNTMHTKAASFFFHLGRKGLPPPHRYQVTLILLLKQWYCLLLLIRSSGYYGKHTSILSPWCACIISLNVNWNCRENRPCVGFPGLPLLPAVEKGSDYSWLGLWKLLLNLGARLASLIFSTGKKRRINCIYRKIRLGPRLREHS